MENERPITDSTYISLLSQSYNTLRYDHLFLQHFIGIEIIGYNDDFSVTNESEGIDLMFNDKLVCTAVHFSAGNGADKLPFTQSLPLHLMFEMSRDRVHVLLGLPDITGGGDGQFHITFGKIPPWEKYLYGDFSLHIQYKEDRMAIDLITLIGKLSPNYA